MILTATLYSLIETFLMLILEATVWISSKMLSSSVTVFGTVSDAGGTAPYNIFNQFINIIFSGSDELVAFGSTVAGAIKGIAYGLIILSVIFSALKSMASPVTGDEEVNPAQAVLRGAVAVILLLALFGFELGSTIRVGGLLSTIGTWFGSILVSLGEISSSFSLSAGIEIDSSSVSVFFENLVSSPAYYVAYIVLTVSLLVSVFGAAITYVERVLSFAVSVILGPVAVSLYANKETSSTTKDWALSLLTQFIAIFISLIMWEIFLMKLADVFTVGIDGTGDSIFRFAVCIVILSLMKNSEKILNSFGLRTISHGDSARAVLAGVGAIGSAAMLGMRAASLVRRGGGKGVGVNGAGVIPGEGSESPYTKDGLFNTGKTGFLGTGNMKGFVTSWNPIGYVKEHRAQADARMMVANCQDALSPSAESINTAFGFNSHTSVEAKGNSYGMMDPVSFDSDRFARNSSGNISFDADGNPEYQKISGWMGDVDYRSSGRNTTLEDAIIVKDGANLSVSAGTSVGLGSNGKERVIESGSPIITSEGHYIYRTTEKSYTKDADFTGSSEEHPKVETASFHHEGNREYNV